MPRKRTGSAFKIGDAWHVQVTLTDGTRSNKMRLPDGTSEARARDVAAALQERADRGELVRADADKPAEGETFDAYADRWLETLRDPKEATAHLRLHVSPAIGGKALQAVTRRDVETIVAQLDERVRGGALAGKTAINIFGTLTKLYADACNAKRLELRALDGRPNPTEGVRGPDRGDERQSSWLFPYEAEALLSCEAVPHRWRVLYALALYTGLRRGELAVLQVRDVVLSAGYLSVHKAHDRATGGIKSTKGRRARRVPIELALRPLLVALTEGRDGADLLLDSPPKQKIAEELRAHLHRAGLERAELHADDERQRPLTFHDLRHTFATWLALRGEPGLTIQSRLGHASEEQTQRYIGAADAVAAGDVGQPFPSLPETLAHKTTLAAGGIALANRSNGQNRVSLLRGGRDSNPRPPA